MPLINEIGLRIFTSKTTWFLTKKFTVDTEKWQKITQMVMTKVDSYVEKTKLDVYLSQCAKVNSEWIKYLQKSLDILNLIQGKIRNIFELIGLSKYLLNSTSMTIHVSSFIWMLWFCNSLWITETYNKRATEHASLNGQCILHIESGMNKR